MNPTSKAASETKETSDNAQWHPTLNDIYRADIRLIKSAMDTNTNTDRLMYGEREKEILKQQNYLRRRFEERFPELGQISKVLGKWPPTKESLRDMNVFLYSMGVIKQEIVEK